MSGESKTYVSITMLNNPDYLYKYLFQLIVGVFPHRICFLVRLCLNVNMILIIIINLLECFFDIDIELGTG